MEAGIEQVEDGKINEIDFYVVSPEKFLVLFLGTFGVYAVYWFYKNWSLFKKSTNESVWPIMRGIFSIFFVHSLFSRMEKNHKVRTDIEATGLSSMATLFVVFSIIGNVGDRLAGEGIGMPFTIFSGIVALPVVCWVLYKAQLIVNASSNDVNGDTNSNYSFVNSFWLFLGAVLWMLVLLGIYSTLNVV